MENHQTSTKTTESPNLREKLECMNAQQVYDFFIKLNFPSEVAQYFRVKVDAMECPNQLKLKKYLFDEVVRNPIQNVYLNVALMKFLKELRKDENEPTSSLVWCNNLNHSRYPYNLRDPFLLGPNSLIPILAKLPPIPKHKLSAPNSRLFDYKSSSCSKTPTIIESSPTTKYSTSVITTPRTPLGSVSDSKLNESKSQSQFQSRDENNNYHYNNNNNNNNSNSNNSKKFCKIIEVSTEFQQTFVDDSYLKLPAFPPMIEDALNDEKECIGALPLMSQSLASHLYQRGMAFLCLSLRDYKSLAKKVLLKYDVLSRILRRNTLKRTKPELHVLKHIQSAVRVIREKANKIREKAKTSKLVEKKVTMDLDIIYDNSNELPDLN